MTELSKKYVLERLPVRPAESNKGTYGKLLCVVGSTQYRGAAALCTEGALRTGAGLVALASVEPVVNNVVLRLPEAVLLPCRTDEQGCIAADEASRLAEYARGCTAAVMGCGMGNTPAAAVLVETLARHTDILLVLDADALNAAARQFPRRKDANLIVTPHPGEMARLTGLSVAQVQADRVGTARKFAAAHNCIVLLKGHHTVIAAPDGQCFLNPTGNPGMAKGGSGDVLAGMIGALLAQKLPPLAAACCGAWLHGTAGDMAAARLGQYGMLPHDLLTELCFFFAQNGR